MFSRLAHAVVRHRRAVLAATVLGLAVAGALGRYVTSELIDGGFDEHGSESDRASDALRRDFEVRDPNLVLLVTARTGTVDDPAVARAGRALARELAAEPGVREMVSYWTAGSAPPLRSTDGSQALVLASIPGRHDGPPRQIEQLSERYTRENDVIRVGVGGWAEVFRQVNEQVQRDLLRSESIAFPVTLVLLVVVFGSVVAATLPLAVGALAISGSLFVLWAIASVTDVSIFALNLTTMMGLGLAIDYSLFVVSRYREELARGLDPHAAVVRTVETAGRTIAFSAFTLAVSLAALLVFELAFLRSFAYAGIAVSLTAALGAVVALPALLAVLGRRVDALTIRRRRRRAEGDGVWHRVATFVMRRPVPVAAGVLVPLVLLGTPFLDLRLGLPDDRALPASMSSRAVHDAIREDFGSQEAGALHVVAPGAGDPAGAAGEIDAYAAELSRLDGVARVDAFTGTYADGAVTRPSDLPPGELRDALAALTERFRGERGTWLSVVPSVEPLSAEGERLAHAVRAVDAPFEVLVGGDAAELVDSKASIGSRLPLALALIAAATFTLLFLMFGSVLVPFKALLLNVLSLSATLGATVWIFQEGHLSGLLDFTATGSIAATMPVLMFCVAFGLSMDYEVFLLSRIKEEHDRTGDNPRSVALGLERTGRIVTAAAVLISVVFAAFATSGVVFVKLFGVGLSLAVLMDAFVIRATLVPAFMRLAGEANWWAPGPLRRLHDRVGLREAPPEPAPEEAPPREPVGAR